MTLPESPVSARGIVCGAATAAAGLSRVPGSQKNQWLEALTVELIEHADELTAPPPESPDGPHDSTPRGNLTAQQLEALAKATKNLAGLGDPIGRVDSTWLRPNGLKIEKVRIPIGVIAFICPPCPVLMFQAATVAIKSGNAAVLCPRNERMGTSGKLIQLLCHSIAAASLPESSMQIMSWSQPEELAELLQCRREVGLAILQTSDEDILSLACTAAVPVLRCISGATVIYVDEEADLSMAVRIVRDVSEDVSCAFVTSVQLLLHERIADAYEQLAATQEVVSRADRLTITRVASVEEGIAAVATLPFGHSAAVVSSDRSVTSRFANLVDTACVYINASPRFTDSSEFGMGAGIGLSTSRIHARGPLGIDEMTTYKYIVTGTGQIRG